MRRKVTAVAPSNIAFIKYWGIRDLEHILPYNPSISMTLSRCVSRTTVEYSSTPDDQILQRLDDGSLSLAPQAFAERIHEHLERLREWAQVDGGIKVATENSFPMGAGLASSASGFAALTLAVITALGHEVSAEELSELARLSGSGSAARSVIGGYVEWPAPHPEGSAHAESLAPAEHWELKDIIAILDTKPKEVSSRIGHQRAPTSPYFETRLKLLPGRLERVRTAIANRSFEELAPVVEEESIDLHLIAMSSHPPIFYWRPETLEVLAVVRQLRKDGTQVCATMDAGANVHLICVPEHEERVVGELANISGVREVIRDGVGPGPEFSQEHLF